MSESESSQSGCLASIISRLFGYIVLIAIIAVCAGVSQCNTYVANSSLTQQDLPASGKVFTKAPSSEVSLKVSNQGSKNYYIKLVKPGKTQAVCAFFVRGNSSATVGVPAGKYEIRYARGGDKWYGVGDYFGSETGYGQMTSGSDSTTFTLENGYSYSLVLDTRTSSGDKVGTSSLSAGSF